MTDPALIRRKLAQIETYVSELRRLARPAELGRDVREERFIFRDVLVHGYDAVNLDVVRDIIEHRLDDLTRFAETIRPTVDE